MAEHHEVGQKKPHFESVGFKNLEKQIFFLVISIYSISEIVYSGIWF